MKKSELIVMLTYHDKTVPNAIEIFEHCADIKAKYWGFKEQGLELSKMKCLAKRMKDCGKKVFLEVVAYTPDEGLEGAKRALECGCDAVMGTVFSRKIADFCRENNLGYFPFLGKVHSRPSVLEGEISDFIEQIHCLQDEGISGFDLLGYRYTQNANLLNETVVKESNLPVCIAGSVNSIERLQEIAKINPWAFTIGSAFFDKCFGDDFAKQIDFVCDYIENYKD